MASTDELTPGIRQAVRDAIREEVSDRLDKLESQVCDLVNKNQHYWITRKILENSRKV